jgi:hypothetical protein
MVIFEAGQCSLHSCETHCSTNHPLRQLQVHLSLSGQPAPHHVPFTVLYRQVDREVAEKFKRDFIQL